MTASVLVGERVKALPKKPQNGAFYLLDGGSDGFSMYLAGSDGILRSLFGAGILAMCAADTPPDGWLVCDGALISRASYSALFSEITTIYGAGDGSTTFQLPDFRGEFFRGWDGGRGVDAARVFGSFQDQSIQSHIHTIFAPNAATSVGGTVLGHASQTGAVTSLSGVTRPRNVAVLPIIKY